mgnify:CR=1 FL=1
MTSKNKYSINLFKILCTAVFVLSLYACGGSGSNSDSDSQESDKAVWNQSDWNKNNWQ